MSSYSIMNRCYLHLIKINRKIFLSNFIKIDKMLKVGILLALNRAPELRTVRDYKDVMLLIKCQGLDTAFIGRSGYNVTIYLDKYRDIKPLNEQMIALYPRYPY